jgi:hypothetical protein
MLVVLPFLTVQCEMSVEQLRGCSLLGVERRVEFGACISSTPALCGWWCGHLTILRKQLYNILLHCKSEHFEIVLIYSDGTHLHRLGLHIFQIISS